jgi:GAF domain-containing protein
VHEPEEELTALAESVVPEFADICRVYLVDPVRPGAGPVAGRRSVTRTAEGVIPSPANDERFSFGSSHPIARCVRTGSSVLVPVPVPREQAFYGPPEQHRWAARIGIRSMLVAPVVSRGVVVAALLFIACGRRPAFSEDDRALVVELAARASVAVEHAEHFQQTRQVSVALQAAMLTAPPTHPGVELQARYLPAAADLEVGGDWYDAFDLPDGDLAVGVGDVAGHDLSAAATMGQLRSMLRALAYETGSGPPAAPSDVVRRLDRVASRLDVTGFTTLLFGRVCRRPAAPCSAGPTPATRHRCWCRRTGSRCCCAAAWGWCWGWRRSGPRVDCEVELEPGATLLLYTDGLVERRNDPHDSRLRRPARPRPPRHAPAVVRPVRPPRPRHDRRHRRRHGRPRAAGAALSELARLAAPHTIVDVVITFADLVTRARGLVTPGRRAVLGIVGSPGSGKSTLAEALLAALRADPPPGRAPSGSRTCRWTATTWRTSSSNGSACGTRRGLRTPSTPGATSRCWPGCGARRTGWCTHRRSSAPWSSRSRVRSRCCRPARLVVTEGNYLLLDTGRWPALRPLLDEVWFCALRDDVRLERLHARHVRFGKAPDEAVAWVAAVDEPNAALIEATRDRADLLVPSAVLETACAASPACRGD